MLVHPWDAPNDDNEWRAVLHECDFGQFIAPGGPGRDLPIVVPTHFIFDGLRTLELHLTRATRYGERSPSVRARCWRWWPTTCTSRRRSMPTPARIQPPGADQRLRRGPGPGSMSTATGG